LAATNLANNRRMIVMHLYGASKFEATGAKVPNMAGEGVIVYKQTNTGTMPASEIPGIGDMIGCM
jgi:hypothetical protein